MYYLFTFFFFNDTATTEIYTLSLHDALPICLYSSNGTLKLTNVTVTNNRCNSDDNPTLNETENGGGVLVDRKSTRLNSSHTVISYAVFCLKKKKKKKKDKNHMIKE